MPPVKFDDAPSGYFSAKRSPAAKFSTASRGLDALFGQGAAASVGPYGSRPPSAHSYRATFGTSPRRELWPIRRDPVAPQSNNQQAPQGSPSIHPTGNTQPRGVSFSQSSRFPIDSSSRLERHSGAPAPHAQTPTTSNRSVAEEAVKQRYTREAMQLRAIYAREGIHRPRSYQVSAVSGQSRGGAIPRSGRAKSCFDVSSSSPGPSAYKPLYGLY
jgi:hypothetical protein